MASAILRTRRSFRIRYWIRSRIVTIRIPCSRQNSWSCGTRAIVPSSFITSQMTPAGKRPARRARSMAASVCPARSRTPPGRARSGNMCPGLSRSSGRVLGSIATRTVCARSAAEMPVVVPCFASIGTQKAVPNFALFCSSPTISGMRSSSSRSAVIGRQMRPRPKRAMKLIASGVTFSAAIVRSPSFSRSSSSTTTIIFPARKSSIASDIELLIRPSSAGRDQSPRAASSRSTYFAMTSASRLTRLPGWASRRFVT